MRKITAVRPPPGICVGRRELASDTQRLALSFLDLGDLCRARAASCGWRSAAEAALVRLASVFVQLPGQAASVRRWCCRLQSISLGWSISLPEGQLPAILRGSAATLTSIDVGEYGRDPAVWEAILGCSRLKRVRTSGPASGRTVQRIAAACPLLEDINLPISLHTLLGHHRRLPSMRRVTVPFHRISRADLAALVTHRTLEFASLDTGGIAADVVFGSLANLPRLTGLTLWMGGAAGAGAGGVLTRHEFKALRALEIQGFAPPEQLLLPHMSAPTLERLAYDAEEATLALLPTLQHFPALTNLSLSGRLVTGAVGALCRVHAASPP